MTCATSRAHARGRRAARRRAQRPAAAGRGPAGSASPAATTAGRAGGGAGRTQPDDQGAAVLRLRRWHAADERRARGAVRRRAPSRRGKSSTRRLRRSPSRSCRRCRPAPRCAPSTSPSEATRTSISAAKPSTAHPGGTLNELLTVYTIVDALTVNLPAVAVGPDPHRRERSADPRRPCRSAPAARKESGDWYNDRHPCDLTIDPPTSFAPTTLTPNYLPHAEGSVFIEAGRTKVICTASIEDRVPPFLRNTGKGWVTAEYGMLPRATSTRTQREASTGKVGGRTQEIQRLIGRSLRSVTNLPALGERTVWIDCDVIQADGGTRTASITGAFVALALALEHAAPARRPSHDSPVGLRRRHQRRHRRRRAAPRPGLRRRFARRRRHEHRQDRRRPVHRGAGNGRGDAVRPRFAPDAARRSPITASSSSSRSSGPSSVISSRAARARVPGSSFRMRSQT